MSIDFEIKKKICLLGSYGVGKTSLVRRFIYNTFEEKYLSTIGVHISKKVISINSKALREEKKVNLFIWDIANIDKFDSVIKSYINGAHGAIIVIDITRPNLLNQSLTYANQYKELNPKGEIIFVGNKIDLESSTKFNRENFIKTFVGFDSEVFFSSAKSGENVEEFFSHLGLKLVKDNFIV